MKRVEIFVVVGFVSILLFGCAGVPKGAGLGATNDQSVVLVQRNNAFVGSLVAWNIYIDNQKVETVKNGSETKVLVKNGVHSIYVGVMGMNSDIITFDAYSEELAFTAYITSGILFNTVHLVQNAAKDELGQANSSATKGQTAGVTGALTLAMEGLVPKIPAKSKIAVLNMSSSDREQSEFAIGEIENILVNSGSFTIMDRGSLDVIRREQNFQMSGDVDDNTAVDIGKLAGASVVITGSISGSGDLRRLRIKALDVKTAQVLSSASEPF